MNIYSQIASNKRKTYLIMFLFIIFITTVAYIFGVYYQSGPMFGIGALIASIILAIFSYFSSSNAILGLSGAKKITKEENTQLFNLVENLCIAGGQKIPSIYIIDDNSPNAFATGRDPEHSSICFTTGILNLLEKSELEGVIAHELSHIKNYDIRLMAIVVMLVGFLALLSEVFLRSMFFRGDRKSNGLLLIIGLILALISPVIATLIQLAVSRKREFLADASGALLTRYPDGLADALEKISSYPKPLKNANNATAHLYIENPFKKSSKHMFSSLFNTHPPAEERIKILRNM